MLPLAQAIAPKIVELRRAIHRNPELGFDVQHTAELVVRTLNENGIEAQTGVGRTGVVGYIGNGDGPTVAIRADMDALPIQEINQVDYVSQVAGKMHACGHDGHTAMLLGAGMLLAKQNFHGNIRLVFQPSEEDADADGVSGAPYMIADGALDGVDAVIALHVDGTVDTGKIGVDWGNACAAVDTFRATIIGKGGHGAKPNQALDPIWLTTQVLSALYAVPSRTLDPVAPSVLTVGIVRGGSASNIIPADVYIEGTLRSVSTDVREQLLRDVERCLSIAKALGGDYRLEIERGYPPLINSPKVSDTIAETARAMLGEDTLDPQRLSMGAEDFSFMTEKAPGAMFRLGVKQPDGQPRYLHTPDFDLDENALHIGSAMLAQTALHLLKAAGTRP
jgi:amidohydrolase